MSNRRIRRVKARYQWDRLRVSFWFAPLVMALAAIVVARLLYRLDGRVVNTTLWDNPLVVSGSVAALRGFLIGMAATVLTTAGIVFTLFTLPLSTVAAQYGSRLLRVFLGDRTTQFVLGMFVATFVYCLSAATSLPAAELAPQSPQITATVGLYLMLAAFGSLVLLVQHISVMLQAPNIAAAAGVELRDTVNAERPETIQGAGEPGPAAAEMMASSGYKVRVRRAGYVQYVDPQTLIVLAHEKDLVIRLLRRPGQFLQPDAALALVWPADRVDEELDRLIRRTFLVGNGRTPTQDVVYAINQLVEMAVRAMSPAINDPFTAMTCLDYIGVGLAQFARQGERSRYYYDRDARVRLILEPVTFAELLSAAFDMLRHCSSDNAAVLLHMLDVIETISREAGSSEAHSLEERRELLRHVNLVQIESEAGGLIEVDRERISRRCLELADLLQANYR